MRSAIVLYIPVNALPIMNTRSLFGSEKDTILSGVVYLRTSGSWPLAVIVFIANIAVSMLKILALLFLVISVQFSALATIQAGPGAIAFGAVVVLTMFAAMSFDPRLIRDAAEKDHG